MNAALYAKLIETAKARKTIPITELARAADLPTDAEGDTKAVGLLLDEIADFELSEGRPLLPVVIVRKETNTPGAGLFRYARRKGLQKTDDLTFFATELNRVYSFWAAKS